MVRLLIIVVIIAFVAVAFARPLFSRAGALQPGAAAPEIAGQSVYAGKIEPFSLKKQLKKGAVVLYFFPAAFTSG